MQRGRYGRLGIAGFLVSFVGFALEFIARIITLIVEGGTSSAVNLVLVLLFLLGNLASFVGLVLLGVAILRARVLPRWFGVLLIVGTVVVVVLLGAQLLTIGLVASGVLWILIGYTLLSRSGTELKHRPRVS